MSTIAQNAKAIFLEAVEKHSAEDWPAYLDEACGDDRELRHRVEGLLQAHEDKDSLFDHPDPTAVYQPREQAGQMIGPYKLREQIGEGGMGTVFVAEQEMPLRRKVALKLIKPGMDSRAVIARFEAERQALALMDHPNIATALDAGTTESGRPYFVMELVRGIPVTEYCDKNKLTIRERCELFLHVCRAIQHAHQKGIIHRDIKPSNVLVTLHDGHPVPKVIDFGVAKALNTRLTDKTIYTEHAQVVGTLLYMSPEQAEFSGLDIDTRSDVYSLGVLLYELLTGTTPFQKDQLSAAGLDEQRRIIRDDEPPRASVRISSLGATATAVADYRKTDPKKLNELIRGDLDWIALKALEKDRTRRYEGVASFAEDVKRYLNDEAVVAYPPTKAYRFRKYARRHKAGILTAGVVCMSLLVGFVSTASQMMRANRIADELAEKVETLETSIGLVKDYTMMLALSGGRDDEKQALGIAEAAGMSGVWKLMLQARAAMQRGEVDTAIALLESGCTSEKGELLACEGMLVHAMIWAGRLDGVEQRQLRLRRKLESLPSPTPEEMLLVGSALAVGNPDEDRWIDKSLERRESILARLIRARFICRRALELDDSRRLEVALADAKDARARFPDSPFVRGESLYVYLTAMLVNRRHSRSAEKFRELQKFAAEDVESLRRHPQYTLGLAMVASYLDCFGPREEAHAAWMALLKGQSFGWQKSFGAAALFRTGDVDAATRLLKGGEMLERIALGMVLSGDEERRSESRKIYDEIHRQQKRVYFLFGTPMNLLVTCGPVGKIKDEAKRLLRDERVVFPTDFDRQMIRFLAGKSDERDVLDSCKNNAEIIMVRFVLARLSVASQDWKNAEIHLNACVATDLVHFSDYFWAKAYLDRFADELRAAHDDAT